MRKHPKSPYKSIDIKREKTLMRIKKVEIDKENENMKRIKKDSHDMLI